MDRWHPMPTLREENMFVLVNNSTGAIFGAKSHYIKSEFDSERSAKAAATRYEKKFTPNSNGRIVFKKSDYSIYDYATYVEPQVEITYTNKYDGSGPYTSTIGINSVGTCTDPRTETYWTM